MVFFTMHLVIAPGQLEDLVQEVPRLLENSSRKEVRVVHAGSEDSVGRLAEQLSRQLSRSTAINVCRPVDIPLDFTGVAACGNATVGDSCSREVAARCPEANLVYVGSKASFAAVIALHKSGTNLIANIFKALGYSLIGSGVNVGLRGAWRKLEQTLASGLPSETCYFNHNLPMEVLGDAGSYTRILLDIWSRESFPLFFHYRDPRDLMLSFISYTMGKAGQAPTQHPYLSVHGEIFNAVEPEDRLIGVAIDILTDYMHRTFLSNAWMLHHPKVMCTSYESLVGERGLGDERSQLSSVASIMVHLNAAGDPREIADQIYNTESRTFIRGRIAAWRDAFGPGDLERFNARYGDILRTYRYPLE